MSWRSKLLSKRPYDWYAAVGAALVSSFIQLGCHEAPRPEPASAPSASAGPLASVEPSRADQPRPRHEAPPTRARFPQEFQVTSMRGTAHDPYIDGNTLDAIRAAHAQGIDYIEVDLVLTADGTLFTAHQPYVKECGTLSRMTLNQVLGCRIRGGLRLARLEDVLDLPFKGVFLDLKDTLDQDAGVGARAVEEAARVVLERGRTRTAVLLLYETSTESLATVERHALRAGLKGYPRKVEETEQMVERAARLGFEVVSVNTEWVTSELVKRSAKLGVWHLPWSTKPQHVSHWRELAEAGVGGLIVLHYQLAREQVAPHWMDARSLAAW